MPYKFNVFTGNLDYYQINSGGVTGISPTTPGAIATWVDTDATTIQNTETNIQTSGAIEAQAYITRRSVTDIITINSDETWISPSIEITLTGSIVINSNSDIIII